MKDDTKTNHFPLLKMPNENIPLVPPIYQSVKFTNGSFANLVQGKDPNAFYYSRNSNPTVRQLELLLADLQGREDAVAVSTGMGAVAVTLLGLLKASDHIVMFLESYKPIRLLVKNVLEKFGITVSFLSIDNSLALEDEIKKKKPKLLFFESPTNPMTRIPNIEVFLKLAKNNGMTTVLDNTFSGFHNHGEYPVDIFIHSLTKYASGHGDVMGGVVIGNKELLKKIREVAILTGPTLDPHAAYLLLRGMKTYTLRYQKHVKNAQAVAEFLFQHPRVKNVYYPGLSSHPDHHLALKQQKDFGSILTFTLNDSIDTVKFIDNLKLFKVAASLGSTESLIAPVLIFYGGDLTQEQRNKMNIEDKTFRLSVGIEAIEDLIEDLSCAFNKC
jgi:cystathionine beta-lyase/cystathionine gamma-synthase